MAGEAYEFGNLPLADVQRGTSVLVSGPSHAGARELALQLLAGRTEEGTIIVTTNQGASRIARSCRAIGVEITRDRTAILDCVGEESDDVPAQVSTVSGPDDLTGLGMNYSNAYQRLYRAGFHDVRSVVHSVSTLLTFSDLRRVSQFVHAVIGRIDNVGGFGAFFIDPTSHAERAVSTIAQFCDGRIEVRESDDEDRSELRVRGLSGQPREWTPFDRMRDGGDQRAFPE